MSTARLRPLQEAFADAVLGGDGQALAGLLEPAGAAAVSRIAIYRRGVGANLERALRTAYPVVLRLVGDAFLGEAARQYAAVQAPRCADLNRYGDGFADFLARYPYAASLPWLSDVARLEWAVHEASMAAEGEPPDFNALARVPAEQQAGLRLTLRPSVRVVRSDAPVLALWEANQPDRDGMPERTEGAERVLVWRASGTVRAVLLAAREADFVEALLQGRPLAVAVGEPDWDVGSCLQRLAQHGALGPFSVNPRGEGAGGGPVPSSEGAPAA